MADSKGKKRNNNVKGEKDEKVEKNIQISKESEDAKREIEEVKKDDKIELEIKDKSANQDAHGESVVANTQGGAAEVTSSKTGKDDIPTVAITDSTKVIQEEVEEKKPVFSIKDLIDALSIIISSGKRISVDSTLDLIEVVNMKIETPQELDVMPLEMDFLL